MDFKQEELRTLKDRVAEVIAEHDAAQAEFKQKTEEKEAILSFIASLQPSIDLAKRFAERLSALEKAGLKQASQQII